VKALSHPERWKGRSPECVRAWLVGKVVARLERLAAPITGNRPLSGMHAEVDVEVAARLERLVALGALVRAFVRVNVEVLGEFAAGYASFGAGGTLERPFLGVRTVVNQAFVVNVPVARWAGKGSLYR
jgi:hypothetical protein